MWWDELPWKVGVFAAVRWISHGKSETLANLRVKLIQVEDKRGKRNERDEQKERKKQKSVGKQKLEINSDEQKTQSKSKLSFGKKMNKEYRWLWKKNLYQWLLVLLNHIFSDFFSFHSCEDQVSEYWSKDKNLMKMNFCV